MQVAIEAMQAAGLSITASRLAVWKVLMSTSVPLSVTDIQRNMTADSVSIPPSSVYAALKRLADVGLVSAQVFDDNRAYFSLMSKRARHRIVCADTGAVHWVFDDTLTDAIEALCNAEGLALQDYSVSIQARRLAASR